MSSLNAHSSLAQIKAAYLENASYAEDRSPSKAAIVATAWSTNRGQRKPQRGISCKMDSCGMRQDRQRFVNREEITQLLAVCDPTRRLILSLARFGGLRCPSEVLSLRWMDIDWAAGRIVVRSPKTEHHPGKDSRIIPLFSELRAALAKAFELAPDGAVVTVKRPISQAAGGTATCEPNSNGY